MKETLSIIGLGKLGASMAAAFASRGYDCIGVDVNPAAIEAVNQGRAPVQETDLDRLIGENKDRIRATASHREAITASDISFVIVPTPSDENGSFSLQYAEWAFREVGRALASKSGYHNVVLTSTVLPGSTRQRLIPVLERESRKTTGKDFGVCYSPEFIALGSIIRNFLNPDFTLIGEFDDRCGEQLASLYSRVVENGAPAARMSIENAELTKISVNTYVTTKITFANMLAEICEKLPGGDVDVVTSALGLDSRIGPKYLKGAIGYGGPCFPRDNVALSRISSQLGVSSAIAEVTDRENRSIAERTTEKLVPMLRSGATVAVLGLSYKPDSHVLEESQGASIARQLSKRGMRVIAYDPMSEQMELDELKRSVLVLPTIAECLSQAEAVLITTPDAEFASLTADDFKNEWAEVLVVDFWRLLRRELHGALHVKYVGIGLSESDTANTSRLHDIWCGTASEEKRLATSD